MKIPKYAKIEYERRWVLPTLYADTVASLPYTLIEDLYLDCGRMRLRSMTDSKTGEKIFKLCKKYGATAVSTEPIVNIYLTTEEYAAFLKLPGHKLTKKRHKQAFGNYHFSVDVFERELKGLVLCEIEADSLENLNTIPKPSMAKAEVTDNEIFSGGKLSQTKAADLKKILSSV
jgi:CYTH domain-containing protein